MKKINFSRILSFLISIISIVLISAELGFKVSASADTYETPDEISIADLKYLSGSSANNILILDAHNTFSYEATAAHKSVIFRFRYEVTALNVDPKVDELSCQIHFSDNWLGDEHGGIFWLRDDKNRISKSGGGYVEAPAFDKLGFYDVELGKLYIESGDNQGKYYLYMKVGDNKILEYIQPEMPEKANIFMTGCDGNRMFDVNWEGSNVKYLVNGIEVDSFNTTADHLEKPEDPAVPTGKEFVGWFDALGLEWDFEKNFVRDNLVLRAGFKDTAPQTSDDVYFNDSTFTPVLRFMVSSDVHIGNTQTERDTNLEAAIKKAYQIAEANQKYNKLDATLFVGDISDSGQLVELQTFKAIVDRNLKSGTQLLVSMGNHDWRGSSQDLVSQFTGVTGKPEDYHTVINDFDFIYVSPNTSNGEHFTTDKAEWLDAELQKAVARDANKPIFVMQHEGIQGTVYGSDAWGVSELTEVLCKYPQVVDFSGHSHYPLSDPRSIWQGTFTALGTGTLHYYETGINNYKNGGVFPSDDKGGWKTGPSEASHAAEFLVIEVDASNAIRVIVYDLLSNSEITRYYIRNVLDEIKYTYSHKERAKTSVEPVFNQGAELKLTAVQNSITLEFNQATSPSIVESYRIELYSGSTLEKTAYALSDYFRKPQPEKIKLTVESLGSEKTYSVKVYAVNVWGDESETPLTGTIKTEKAEEERFAYYDDVNVMDFDYPDNTGILENIPSEYTATHYTYPGKSPSYSVKLSYFLITNELTSKDEFRTQIGTRESYWCTLWLQTNKFDKIFYSWKFADRPSDGVNFLVESYHTYRIECATIKVEAGENVGKVYTYFTIEDVNNPSNSAKYEFYANPEDAQSTDYEIACHITPGYMIADVRLERNIEFIVDDQVYENGFAINGLYLTEPTAPTKEDWYFVGWYTEPTGGERVDFNQRFESEDETVKYYARFTDETFDANFYNEDGTTLITSQVVGKDCELIKPEDPTKTGQYKYVFVKWVDKVTGEDYDFKTRATGDINLKAVFEEYKYRIVYLVDGLEYETRYFKESDPTVIIGGQPDVPTLKNATGKWIYSSERSNKDIYVTAVYDGTQTTPSSNITLNKFNGATVDIADDLTRFYLNFSDTEEQAEWIQNYPVSGGHERQNISFSWNDENRNMAYLVYFADNAEFKNAFIVKADKNNLDNVGIFVPGKTYYWKVYGISTDKCSDVDTFKILDEPTRWISAGTVFNMRDIGGWTTLDGEKQINYSMIYRGGQLSIDQAGEKSAMNDYSYKVFSYLGIKTEIELRGDKPHDINQFNEFEKVISVNGKGYSEFFNVDNNAKQNYRDVFALLADRSNYPFYFHCSWGADRTGGLGFLLEAVLGVPYETLVQDYELTSLSYSGSRTRYGYSAGAFDIMYKRFMSTYGGEGKTLQEAVTKYLIEYMGVNPDHIDAFKEIMLTDASQKPTTHKVTFKIDGEVYQVADVYEGTYARGVTPFYIEKHLDHWELNGQPFDINNTKVTSDLVLEAVFKETLYEDYDIVTVRDLILDGNSAGENLVPSANLYSVQGTSVTGSRMFVFDYQITANDAKFDDGVHVEIGLGSWDYKAHVWFQGTNSQHVFTNGATPTASYTRSLTYGNTYRISIGVLIPIDGEYAGKKMFIVKIGDEVLTFIPTTGDIETNFNIGIAGTEGTMKSIPNERSIKFVGPDGLIDTKTVVRGNLVSAVPTPQSPEANKVFLGWFDELGAKWDFNNDKVYKDATLTAKFGDLQISAVVIDNEGYEILHDYKVTVGIKVSEIEMPLVPSDNLVFDGWYNGIAKLNGEDVVTSGMELVCKFNIVEPQIVDPQEPTGKGCNSAITSSISLVAMISLAGALIIRKKKNERD